MRSVKEIYDEIIEEKNKRMELNEINSKSRVSIMNGIAWVVAAAIRSLEVTMEVFGADTMAFIDKKIHGTADYYANALLKYQHGDELTIREDGLGFGYLNIDPSKNIITKVAYFEQPSDLEKDNRALYKLATGAVGSLRQLDDEQMIAVRAYIDKIKFLGTNIDITSRKGDVLIPRITVYHNGMLPESVLMEKIVTDINDYISILTFDAMFKVSEIIDVVMHVDTVTDVFIDPTTEPAGGIYVAKYDNEHNLTSPEKIDRITELASGYLVESSKMDDEKDLPSFKECITLKVER